MVFTWKECILFIASILLIMVVLLQDSKDDSSQALTGEKNGLFKDQKARGIELVFTYVTLGIALVYVTFAILSVAL